jgi:MarR family transcriptional regulator, transcriptional regulator for hemolysin
VATTAAKGPSNVDVDLMFLLSQASHALETELTARLQALGVSPRAHCVLTHALRGGELTQSQVAEHCALDKTTMVVTMDELERAGLAERRASSTDRRARIIAVTNAGERIVAEADAIVAGIYGDVLAALPAGQRDAFVAGLAQLVGGRLATPVKCERPVRRRAVRAPQVDP